MKPDVVVDFLDFGYRDLNCRSLLAIFIIAIGYDGVQPVIAAIELNDDQDPAACGGLFLVA